MASERLTDPSILAANFNLNPVQRLSFDSTEEEDSSINVYLRIRPHDECEDTQKINYIINGSSFQLKGAKSDTIKSYSFSHVFNDQSKQSDIYEVSVKNLVSHFIEGNNSTIMTYGTSGAGKTHTLLGSIHSPGIVPRVLYNLFKILPMAPKTMLLKPNEHLEVEQLSSKCIADEQKNKTQLLKLCIAKKRRSLFSYSSMQDLLDQNTEPQLKSGTSHYTLWVSFAEIYNECIYDLLDTTPVKNGQSRPKLKLCENKYSTYYIKNLTKIPIRNGEEAYKILKYGQRNLQYAATNINKSSSRSHCIFTLYLIKCEDNMATLSHFNFCDLAGSERVINTQHKGDRLKEAQSINSSLHVLGRCLTIIRENQSVDERKQAMVPYRESKLTKLFHRALLGQERLSLLVNLNPKLIFLDETMNTLNFASIAQEIILDKEYCNRKSRARISGEINCAPSSTMYEIIEESSDNESSNEAEYSKEELYDIINDQAAKINELEMELSRTKIEMAEQERQLREELVAKFSKILEQKTKRYEMEISELKSRHEAELSDKIQSSHSQTGAYESFYSSEDEADLIEID